MSTTLFNSNCGHVFLSILPPLIRLILQSSSRTYSSGLDGPFTCPKFPLPFGIAVSPHGGPRGRRIAARGGPSGAPAVEEECATVRTRLGEGAGEVIKEPEPNDYGPRKRENDEYSGTAKPAHVSPLSSPRPTIKD